MTSLVATNITLATVLCTTAVVPQTNLERTEQAQVRSNAVTNVLASGALKTQPNPVVLEFLDALGSDRLTPEQLERARKQTVSGLRERTEVTQFSTMAAMTEAMPGMMKSVLKEQFKPKNLLRGRLGGNTGSQSEIMEAFSSALVEPWVRGLAAARALRDAGYQREAAAFYRRCLAEPTMAVGAEQQISASAQRVRNGCLDDLVLLSPDVAVPILGALADTEASDNEAQAGTAAASQAAGFSGLARLIEARVFDAEQQAVILESALYIAQQPKRKLVDHSVAAAIAVLGVAADEQSKAILIDLSGKQKSLPQASVAARTALARGYGHSTSKKWLVARMEEGETGTWQAFEVLMAMNHGAAWDWAQRQLKRSSVPQDEADWRPPLIELFAGGSDERSFDILLSADDSEAKAGDYIQVLLDIALFQRGERDRLPVLASALEQPEWELGRRALGRKWQLVKPLVKVGAAAAIGLPIGVVGQQSNQEMVANLAFGAADLKAENETAQESAARQLRFRIAAALADWNNAAALPLIGTLLHFEDDATRIAGARALLGQTSTDTTSLLLEAIQFTYDPVDLEEPPSDPRTPEIVAALMMHADWLAGLEPEVRAVLGDIERFDSPSTRFLALVLTPPDAG